jgi:signal transduction histidine kinase
MIERIILIFDKFKSMLDELIEKNKEPNMVGRFTKIIGISILLTVFFVSGFNIYTSNAIIKQYEADNNLYYSTLANTIFENANQNIKSKKFDTVESFTGQLIKNNLVLFVGIVDTKSNKYVWSSEHDLIGQETEIDNPWINMTYKSKFSQINPENIKEIVKIHGQYAVISNFYSQNNLRKIIEIVLKGNFFLLINFVVFGFLVARITASSLTKPIKELAFGAEEFSRGNLSYRSAISSKDEIGKLSTAFNDMADKLDNLYSSLEQQVKKRTKELSIKNVQLEHAYVELKEAQLLLVHKEKMSSLGQLTAGLAHELNNPINFIYGNLAHLKNYSGDLIKIIKSFEEFNDSFAPEVLEKINQTKDNLDFKFIAEDLPMLIKSCQDGAERCKQIIIDLKNFSRLDEAFIKEVDIHEGIDSTLNILHHKIKNKVNIHKEYGNIPKFSCYAGQLNQVFMNIIDNSLHALKEKGDLYIKTYTENDNVVIIIKDNGSGISKEYLSKIFDPFFTTKPVGEGTGLGLSISYKIIRKHNGNIEVESEEGEGTKFTITLPINWSNNNTGKVENVIQETPNEV